MFSHQEKQADSTLFKKKKKKKKKTDGYIPNHIAILSFVKTLQ